MKFRLLRKSDQSPVDYRRVAEAAGKEVPWDQQTEAKTKSASWELESGDDRSSDQRYVKRYLFDEGFIEHALGMLDPVVDREIAEILQQTLNEEARADNKLTSIAETQAIVGATSRVRSLSYFTSAIPLSGLPLNTYEIKGG